MAAISAPNRAIVIAACLDIAQQDGYAGLNVAWTTLLDDWITDLESAGWVFG